jgi:hypothetical protein
MPHSMDGWVNSKILLLIYFILSAFVKVDSAPDRLILPRSITGSENKTIPK